MVDRSSFASCCWGSNQISWVFDGLTSRFPGHPKSCSLPKCQQWHWKQDSVDRPEGRQHTAYPTQKWQWEECLSRRCKWCEEGDPKPNPGEARLRSKDVYVSGVFVLCLFIAAICFSFSLTLFCYLTEIEKMHLSLGGKLKMVQNAFIFNPPRALVW